MLHIQAKTAIGHSRQGRRSSSVWRDVFAPHWQGMGEWQGMGNEVQALSEMRLTSIQSECNVVGPERCLPHPPLALPSRLFRPARTSPTEPPTQGR